MRLKENVHLLTCSIYPWRPSLFLPRDHWLSSPQVQEKQDSWDHLSVYFPFPQFREKPESWKQKMLIILQNTKRVIYLSLFIKLVDDLLLPLDELLGLAGAVAANVPGGEHLLLSQPLHVGRQLISVLSRQLCSLCFRDQTSSYLIGLPQALTSLLCVSNFR